MSFALDWTTAAAEAEQQQGQRPDGRLFFLFIVIVVHLLLPSMYLFILLSLLFRHSPFSLSFLSLSAAWYGEQLLHTVLSLYVRSTAIDRTNDGWREPLPYSKDTAMPDFGLRALSYRIVFDDIISLIFGATPQQPRRTSGQKWVDCSSMTVTPLYTSRWEVKLSQATTTTTNKTKYQTKN